MYLVKRCTLCAFVFCCCCTLHKVINPGAVQYTHTTWKTLLNIITRSNMFHEELEERSGVVHVMLGRNKLFFERAVIILHSHNRQHIVLCWYTVFIASFAPSAQTVFLRSLGPWVLGYFLLRLCAWTMRVRVVPRRDSRNREGVFETKHGVRYEGCWRMSRRNGEGCQEWPDGERYNGHWKNDFPDGQGTWLRRSGRWIFLANIESVFD